MRAGTEATPQIAAFGTAAEIGSAKMAQATKTMAELRAHAIDRLTAEWTVLSSSAAARRTSSAFLCPATGARY